MFTEHGLKALAKFILIVVVATILGEILDAQFGWEKSARFIYCGFLLTYIVNYEQVKAQQEKVKKILRAAKEPDR